MKSFVFLICTFLLFSIATAAYLNLNIDIPKSDTYNLQSYDKFNYTLCNDGKYSPNDFSATIDKLVPYPYPLDLSELLTVVYAITLDQELTSDVNISIKVVTAFYYTFKEEFNACELINKYGQDSNLYCPIKSGIQLQGTVTLNLSQYESYQSFLRGSVVEIIIASKDYIFTCLTFPIYTT